MQDKDFFGGRKCPFSFLNLDEANLFACKRLDMSKNMFIFA